MNLIVCGILLLKLSTNLVYSKSEDDQFSKLRGDSECGKVIHSYRDDLKSNKERCMKISNCIGVCIVGCDEKNKEIDLCKAGHGFRISRRGSCVYEKKVKTTPALTTSSTSTTASNTPTIFSSQEILKTSLSVQTESAVSNVSSITTNLTSPAPSITLTEEKLSTAQSVQTESTISSMSSNATTSSSSSVDVTDPQSTLMVYNNRSLLVTAIEDDRLVDGEDAMTLTCLTDQNWKTCIWHYNGRVCKLEYSFNESLVGIKWTYDEVFRDPEFGDYTFIRPKDYEYGNQNKECRIKLPRVPFEGEYKCKLQRCNPEEKDLEKDQCKTKISPESPMFEDTISVKIRKNKPKVEDPDQEESGGCKLNAKEEIFLMISISTAQILASLLPV